MRTGGSGGAGGASGASGVSESSGNESTREKEWGVRGTTSHERGGALREAAPAEDVLVRPVVLAAHASSGGNRLHTD